MVMLYILCIYILCIYFLIPLVIHLFFYTKHKLVPAFYYNLCFVSYSLLFLVAFFIVCYKNWFTYQFILVLILIVIGLGTSLYSLKDSIKKGIKLRLNKKLLSKGKKIKISKLYFKQYRPLRRYYLCYYTGTYKDSNGRNHKFKTEDYFDHSYNILLYKKIKKKKSVTIYVDMNDESKYYYKIDDLN